MAFKILNTDSDKEKPYTIEPNRWYKAYPYGFAFWTFDAQKKDLASETFWLPIAPNNINITTHFATNIITTLYGIIEEHSEIRYYDIVISGNTGIAPKFTTPFSVGTDLPATATDGFGAAAKMLGKAAQNPGNPGGPSIGRDFFRPDALAGALSALGGFLPEVTNTISAAANLASSIASGGGVSNPTGIKPEQSGYYAFHNFYKFLLRYKQDTSRSASSEDFSAGANQLAKNLLGKIGSQDLRQVHPLQFLNYKDNVKYDVIPISFTLVRSAENPMLYVYTIKLRAFNLQNVTAKPPATNLLADLGLGNLKGSLFSKITGVVGNASTLISGISGAF